MAGIRQPGSTEIAPGTRRPVWLPGSLCVALAFCACSLPLVGCQQDGRMAATDRDPLVGSQPPLPPPPAPASASPTGVASLGPLPAPPSAFTPTSQTSPAALAAGTPANFDRSQELRIGNAPAAPSPGPLTSLPPPGPPTGPPPPAPAVTLQQPAAPGPAPAWQDSAITPTAAVAAPPQASNYEQLRQLLLARGVTYMRLETWGNQGGWKFTCSLLNPHDPGKMRTYEAEAQQDVAAMQAVLDQMDKER